MKKAEIKNSIDKAFRILLLLILLVVNSVKGQQLYFPSVCRTDSMALEKNVPALATRVMALYREVDRQIYFDNLFRLQMAAGQYQESLHSLDSLRLLLGGMQETKVVGLQFESYAKTKISEATTHRPFQKLFENTLIQFHSELSAKQFMSGSAYFSYDVVFLHSQLKTFLSQLPVTDSIDLQQALLLCRLKNSYTVYSQISSLAKPLLAQWDKDYIINDSVLIKTSDGATIAATIVRKKGTGPLPVILVFNIYSGPPDLLDAKLIASQGFAGIVANIRGKRLSPQDAEPFEHDAQDAYDIIDWINQQPWCNGKVGMFGGSYLGFSQWSATKRLHPALKTIVPQAAVGAGIDFPANNGIFSPYNLRWLHYVTNNKNIDVTDFSNTQHWDSLYRKYYALGIAFYSLDSLDKRPHNIFQRWLQHPAYDHFWQKMSPFAEEFSKINIPVLTITGYYDDDQRGALYYYHQHMKYNPGATHYLIIGPYDHSGPQGNISSKIQGYAIDSVARIDMEQLVFDWFDHILKDSSRPAFLQDKVNLEVMRANKWRHLPSINHISNDTLRFYLSNVRTGIHYKLSPKELSSSDYILQEVDLADRSDSISVGANDDYMQIEDNLLHTVANDLSFITAPFKDAVEINGSFTARLAAAINKKDMDLQLHLLGALPDGKYQLLSNIYARSSYVRNRYQRQLLIPGKKEIIILNNTFFTSIYLPAGSRLILQLGILKDPKWQINYGTGKDVSSETIADATEPFEIKWFSDSYIEIPVWR